MRSTDILVVCDGLPPFSAEVFEHPPVSSESHESWSRELFDELRRPLHSWLPQENWRLLSSDGRRAAFGHGEPPILGGYVELHRHGDDWSLRRSGEFCIVAPFIEGREAARWGLPVDSDPPGPDSEVFEVLVNDRQCASGRNPGHRLRDPEIRLREDEAIVLFSTERLGGNQNCLGHPPARWMVDLGEPLGHRRLLDGGVYPPQPPCPTGTLDCVGVVEPPARH